MQRADIALWVALASFTFTALGVSWGFWLYRLSGPRLVVRLIPSILGSNHTIVRGPEGGFQDEIPAEMARVLDQWTVDLAEVQITNVGRLPISVYDVGLDLGSIPPRWRRGRHTVRGSPIAVHGGVTDEVIRLETGETARVLFDLSAIVGDMRSRGHDKVVVRASATAAGRRPRRSRFRKRWMLGHGRWTLRPGEDVTPELRAYRALWRSLARIPDGPEQAQAAWLAIISLLGDVTTVDGLAVALESILGPGQRMRAHLVLEAFGDGSSRS